MKRFYIKERLFAMGAKFDVYDENDNEVYLVEADKFDIGKNISVYSPNKDIKYVYLEQKIRIGAHKYEIYDARGNSIGMFEKEFMVPNYKTSGEIGDIELLGSGILGRSYDILRNGISIGNFSKELTFGRDRYILEISDESINEILIGFVIVVDMVRFHNKGNN